MNRVSNSIMVSQPTSQNHLNVANTDQFLKNFLVDLFREYGHCKKESLTCFLRILTDYNVPDSYKQAGVTILDRIARTKIDKEHSCYLVNVQIESEKYLLVFNQNRVTITNVNNLTGAAEPQKADYLFPPDNVDLFALQEHLAQEHRNRQSCCINNQDNIVWWSGWVTGCSANTIIGFVYGGYAAGPLMSASGLPAPALASVASTFLNVIGAPIANCGHWIARNVVGGSIPKCLQEHHFQEDLEAIGNAATERTPLLTEASETSYVSTNSHNYV